ncbi:MAG: hypothetical protein H0U97_00740 [Gammaproteobacteria bacterium]|nr:hypothetical protein [Gammaproteobacteria bacterium]
MTTLILVGIGAALMYFFDPDSGRRRRERLREQCTSATRKLQGSTHTPAPDLSNRRPGVNPETPPGASDDQPPVKF